MALNNSYWKGYKPILEEYYDESISVKDNQELLHSLGYDISLNTLYRYAKDNGIKTKFLDDEIYQLIDTSLSLRQNQKLLLNSGIKISLNKINRILKAA
ncbi:MAG: hypothetical protein IIT65_13255 [Lachnospiraceae bacterium]|nr:hypothetical protein [Lachnospiraceae bacterium]